MAVMSAAGHVGGGHVGGVVHVWWLGACRRQATLVAVMSAAGHVGGAVGQGGYPLRSIPVVTTIASADAGSITAPTRGIACDDPRALACIPDTWCVPVV